MRTRMMIAVLLIGTMISCSKKENLNNVIGEQQTEMQATANAKQALRNNPYDSTGIRHNVLVDMLRNYQKETGDTTRAGMKSFFIKELHSKTGHMPDIDLDKIDMLFQRLQQVGLSKFLNSETGLSEPVKKYFLRLEEIVKGIKSAELFLSFQVEVSSLEQEVLKSHLPQRDQEAILRVSSIAYHSGSFWKNVYDTNTWLDPLPQPEAIRWWHWPIIIHADLMGGILGALLGVDVDDAAGWMSGGAEGVLGSYL